MIDHFSKNDLIEICFELGIDHENLSERKKSLAREMIEEAERNGGQVDELLEICKNKRNNVDWPEPKPLQSNNLPEIQAIRTGVATVEIGLETFEQPIIPANNDKWVSIKVVNKGNDHLTNCYGTLEIDGMPLQLGWSGGSTGVKDIRRGSSELLDIARTFKQKGVFAFTTQNRGDWPEKKPGRYSFQVTVGGDLKGKSIIPILFIGDIEYKGGTDLLVDGQSKPFPSKEGKSTFPSSDLLKQPSRWKRFDNE